METLTQPIDVMTSNLPILTGHKARSKADIVAMDKAAKDFESVFMSQMLKPMWDGIETDTMFGGGPGEEAMRGLLIQEYGKSMAQADGFGLSNAVMAQMVRMQEQAHGNVKGYAA